MRSTPAAVVPALAGGPRPTECDTARRAGYRPVEGMSISSSILSTASWRFLVFLGGSPRSRRHHRGLQGASHQGPLRLRERSINMPLTNHPHDSPLSESISYSRPNLVAAHSVSLQARPGDRSSHRKEARRLVLSRQDRSDNPSLPMEIGERTGGRSVAPSSNRRRLAGSARSCASPGSGRGDRRG